MLTAIGDVMRRVYERGWITTRDGNISMRKREGKYLYITPSGWRKTIVHPEHVVRLEVMVDPGSGLLVPNVRDGQKIGFHFAKNQHQAEKSRSHQVAIRYHAAIFAKPRTWQIEECAGNHQIDEKSIVHVPAATY